MAMAGNLKQETAFSSKDAGKDLLEDWVSNFKSKHHCIIKKYVDIYIIFNEMVGAYIYYILLTPCSSFT